MKGCDLAYLIRTLAALSRVLGEVVQVSLFYEELVPVPTSDPASPAILFLGPFGPSRSY